MVKQMHPFQFTKVIERLQQNSIDVLDFHTHHAKQIRKLGLFQQYIQILFQGRVEVIQSRYSKDRPFEEYELKGKRQEDKCEYDVNPRLIKVGIRKEAFDIDFSSIDYITKYLTTKDYEKLMMFWSTKLIQYAVREKFPVIKLDVPKETVKSLELYMNSIPYEITQKKAGETEIKVTLRHNELVMEDVSPVPIVRIANRLFGGDFSFDITENGIKTNASESIIYLPNKDKHELSFYQTNDEVKQFSKKFQTWSSFRETVHLSYDPQLREEEIEAVVMMVFYGLWEAEEDLFNLSGNIRERIRKYLLNRFKKVDRLPEDDSVFEFLLAGDWNQIDSYGSKIFKWLDSLLAISSNSYGVVLYYDGRLDGLTEKGYFIFPFNDYFYISHERITPTHYVFTEKEEALKELQRLSEILLNLWNIFRE